MRKVKVNPNLYFDYRDVKTLQRYIDIYGKAAATVGGGSEEGEASGAFAIRCK